MPEPNRPGERPAERSAARRQADHLGLARLSDTLVPALVAKLNASGLGEIEVREDAWRIRLRRPSGAPTGARRADRPRLGSHGPTPAPAAASVASAASRASAEASPRPERPPATSPALSPAVGVFRPVAAVGARVRAGDRVAVVDLLGIPQDVVSPIDGTVAEVLAQAGDPVEYGEEVLLVEADAEEPAEEPATGETTGETTGGEA